MKPKKFFFHYNKPASLKRGRPVLSLHFDRRCHLVEGLECHVTTRSKSRATSPRVVIEGYAKFIGISDDFAIIDNFTWDMPK